MYVTTIEPLSGVHELEGNSQKEKNVAPLLHDNYEALQVIFERLPRPGRSSHRQKVEHVAITPARDSQISPDRNRMHFVRSPGSPITFTVPHNPHGPYAGTRPWSCLRHIDFIDDS